MDGGNLSSFEHEGSSGSRDAYLHDEIFRLMDLQDALVELKERTKSKGVNIAGKSFLYRSALRLFDMADVIVT